MAIAFMRNRRTTENRAVELDGPEFLAMREEIHPQDGRPVWEQTSDVDQRSQVARIESGETRDEDVGDAHQPVARIMDTGPGIEVGGDAGYVTEGERENGLTPEDKQEQIADDPRTRSDEFGPQETVVPVEDLKSDDADGTSSSGYNSKSKSDLEDEAESRNLPKSGTKADLVARLEENDQNSESTSE
jgi:hypothetical protein